MLGNRGLVLASVVFIAALVAVIALGPRVDREPAAPAPRIGATGEGLPTDVPRVATVAQYVASLSPQERSCLDAAVGQGAADELESGGAEITDPQLEALNACVNGGLPNAGAVVQ